MLSGLLPDWEPENGHTTIWQVSDQSRNAIGNAVEHPVMPSYIQRRHFIDACESSAEHGQHRSSFAVLSFEIDDEYDAELMEAVFTSHLRRHGAYHTWVRETAGGYSGRTIAPADITLSRTVETEEPGDIRRLIAELLPDITEWDMFLFAVVGTEKATPGATDPRFTVVFAVDHFYTDGLSLGIIMYEIITCYRRLRRGEPLDLPDVESYAEYCKAEADHTGALHLNSADVQKWLTFIEGASRTLPSFPLPLDVRQGERVRGTSTVLSEFASAEDCEAFNATCKQLGGNTNSGVLAIAGLIHHAATGDPVFSMLTPVSTRLTRAQILSVGWYTRLVPVQFELGSDFPEYASTVTAAHTATRRSKTLIHTPLHHVAELLGPLQPETVPQNFAAPMISYLDTRSMPGNDLVSRHKMTVHGSVDDSSEVFLWINRTREGMDLNFIHPDTTVARESVAVYAETFCTLFHHLARANDANIHPAEHLTKIRQYRTAEGVHPEPVLPLAHPA